MAKKACGGSKNASHGKAQGRIHSTKPRRASEVPAVTDESRRLAAELKKRGFQFLGPTTCYALMQAVEMVNDHLIGCVRYRELGGNSE
jgi:DNA-3-methyladenine glycosylase I